MLQIKGPRWTVEGHGLSRGPLGSLCLIIFFFVFEIILLDLDPDDPPID
jgi:hypothetical protein